MRFLAHISWAIALGATALVAVSPAEAQFVQQGAKLVGTGASGNANQGFSAALSADGNTMLVGGYTDNASAGATWVFTRSGGVWTQQGTKLVGTGGCLTIASQTNSQLPGQEPPTQPRVAGPASTTPKTSGGGMSAGAKIAIAAVVIGGGAGAAIALSGKGNRS